MKKKAKEILATACVRHAGGCWCATATGRMFREGSASVKTRCGYYVTFPGGSERRQPTCVLCLARLRAKKKAKRKTVKGKRATRKNLTKMTRIVLPATDDRGAVIGTWDIKTATMRTPKRPVLYVVMCKRRGLFAWVARSGDTLVGENVFQAWTIYKYKRASLADARRVLKRFCAGCDVRYPK